MKEVLAELHALSNNPATEWLTESFEKLIPNFSERKVDVLKVLEVLLVSRNLLLNFLVMILIWFGFGFSFGNLFYLK